MKLFKWISKPSKPNEKWFLIWGNNATVGGWSYNKDIRVISIFTKTIFWSFKDAVETDPPENVLVLKSMIKDLFEGEILWQ